MAWYRCGGTPSEVLSLPTPSEASGAIARFNTDLTENLLSAVADFSASQASGTPTPSTPIPIVGVDKVNVVCCGKNLVSDILTGMTVGSNGAITNTGNVNSLAIAPIKSGYTYTITTDDTTGFVGGYFTEKPTTSSVTYNNARVVTSNKTFTAPIDGWVAFRTSYGYATSQLEFGLTATTYEAPTVTTAIINLGGTYYGGEVDAVTGKITLTHKAEKISDLNLSYQSSYSRFRSTVVRDEIKPAESNQQALVGLRSSCFIATPSNSTYASNYGVACDTSGYLFIYDSDYTDPTDLVNALGNEIVLYPLATPLVVYASNTAEIPTIVGDNQVFADSGNIAVKYFETVGHKI